MQGVFLDVHRFRGKRPTPEVAVAPLVDGGLRQLYVEYSGGDKLPHVARVRGSAYYAGNCILDRVSFLDE